MSNQPANAVDSNDDTFLAEICTLLTSNLGLPQGVIALHSDTKLLGVIPEMDSMSVVGILMSLEEQYGIVIHDDELDARVFETLGSLASYVQSKLD